MEQEKFKRELSLFGSVAILAGIIIGTGIFLSSNSILVASNNSPIIAIFIWLIGGLLTLFAGLCYAELGAMMPQAGGAYVYLNKAFGPLFGFLQGMSNFLIGNPGSLAAIALGFSGFITFIVPISDIQVKILAMAIILILGIINYFGVKFGSIIQNLTLIGKLIPLGLIIIVGIFLPGDYSLMQAPIKDPTFPSIASAIVLSLWAYEGWTNLNIVSEEIKNPKKNLPLAIAIALILVITVYVGYNFVMFKTLSIEQIVSSSNPAALTFKAIFGSKFAMIITLGILISMLGSLNGCTLVFPRTYYAMANDKLFFTSLAKVHPKYKTPHIAIIWSTVIGMLFVLIGNFETLTEMVIFCGWTFNALTIFSIFIFRKKMPNAERPYKVIGYPIIPILVIISIAGILISTLIDLPILSIMGIIIVFGVGTPLYFLFKKINNIGGEN